MTFRGGAATQDALHVAALDGANADAVMAVASALARQLAAWRGVGLRMLVVTGGDDGIRRPCSSMLGDCSFVFPVGEVKFWIPHSFTVHNLNHEIGIVFRYLLLEIV